MPDEGDYPTELEGKWRVDGMWIDLKLLIAGRNEEMEYMMKMGVFKVVDEKDCYDNGCKPLMLKWVDKMKGENCRSRLVCTSTVKLAGGFTHFYLKDMSKLASWPDFAEACTERVTQRQSGETHGQMC